MPRKYKEEPEATSRPALDATSRRLMIYCLIRLPVAFERVKSLLTPEHFDKHLEYQLIWRKLVAHYARTATAPSRAMLIAELRREMRSRRAAEMQGYSWDKIHTLVRRAFAMPIKGQKQRRDFADWAVKAVATLLETALLKRSAALQPDSDSLPNDSRSVLAEISVGMDRLRRLTRAVIATRRLYPDSWQTAPVGKTFRSTGLTFLDRFLGGKAAATDTHGILGGYGSCKTTLGNMLTVEAAKQEMARAQQPNYDGKKKLALMFYWEAADENEFRHRALSYTAEIDIRRLHRMQGWESLSRRGHLQDYERKLFAGKLRKGEKVPGERERAKQWMPMLNDYTCYCDMSGAQAEFPNRGADGVDEVVDEIRLSLEEFGAEAPSVVVVDYVGSMANRHMTAHNIPNDQYRHYIKRFVLELKNKVAGVFKCDVWILHQLNAESNSRRRGGISKMSDAAECKAFAEHLDFCFPIGLPLADGRCVLSCEKHRREGQLEPEVIQIEGQYCRVLSTKGYMLDPVSSTIVEESDVKRIQKPPVFPKKTTAVIPE